MLIKIVNPEFYIDPATSQKFLPADRIEVEWNDRKSHFVAKYDSRIQIPAYEAEIIEEESAD